MENRITLEQLSKWSTALSTNVGRCPSQAELLHHLFDVVDERDGVTRVRATPTQPTSRQLPGRGIQLKAGNPLLLISGGPQEAFRVACGLSTDEAASLDIVTETDADGSTWVFEKTATEAKE